MSKMCFENLFYDQINLIRAIPTITAWRMSQSLEIKSYFIAPITEITEKVVGVEYFL